ncbi:tRNA pseudouridine(38-40) synthase TruA [Persicirhabdus sediminis]|uniref:tRNA pseudouridine synthase A n=1 Tax=Persicirhabdus sediminis TaxID=454144 RepID=A0A8J7MF89_9BACT|nr:tRNA pseudouridine(38-40) synthase TruA [Persicirhabdus sediminis]MBK1790714.1 tRNA pseudouridine(38-40) synthase TruA [Persicirhabdus sediminis]
MNLKLTIAYDGRPFEGWQSQPCGNTVQDLLEKAMAEVAKQPVRIQGSGRTDSGVSAFGQVASFVPPAEISMNPYNWVPALNTKLPAAIRVLDCQEVAETFHARFSAKAKTYQYELCLEPILPPLKAGLAWHLPRLLDPVTLEQALEVYLGTHDYKAFAANRGNETASTDYVRTITESRFEVIDGGYRLIFTGDGFMYKMVRLMVGAAVQVAQGRLRMDDFQALLDQEASLPNGKSPLCAPADGLSLVSVDY